eukprot:6937032-Lingulodinium_polyedra.AAC.1
MRGRPGGRLGTRQPSAAGARRLHHSHGRPRRGFHGEGAPGCRKEAPGLPRPMGRIDRAAA